MEFKQRGTMKTNDQTRDVIASVNKAHEATSKIAKHLTQLSRPESVFASPVNAGEHTIITASEVTTAMGMGFGIGGGTDDRHAPGANGTEASGSAQSGGAGGGGGGGGTSLARPVAVISVGPDGVKVEPVVDVTKIGLAVLTMLGGAVMMLAKMKKGKV
jgi:uncharacterized spore protein YtfJ